MNEIPTTLECIQMFTKREELALQFLKIIINSVYQDANPQKLNDPWDEANSSEMDIDKYLCNRAFDLANDFLEVSKERSNHED